MLHYHCSMTGDTSDITTSFVAIWVTISEKRGLSFSQIQILQERAGKMSSLDVFSLLYQLFNLSISIFLFSHSQPSTRQLTSSNQLDQCFIEFTFDLTKLQDESNSLLPWFTFTTSSFCLRSACLRETSNHWSGKPIRMRLPVQYPGDENKLDRPGS